MKHYCWGMIRIYMTKEWIHRYIPYSGNFRANIIGFHRYNQATKIMLNICKSAKKAILKHNYNICE